MIEALFEELEEALPKLYSNIEWKGFLSDNKIYYTFSFTAIIISINDDMVVLYTQPPGSAWPFKIISLHENNLVGCLTSAIHHRVVTQNAATDHICDILKQRK